MFKGVDFKTQFDIKKDYLKEYIVIEAGSSEKSLLITELIDFEYVKRASFGFPHVRDAINKIRDVEKKNRTELQNILNNIFMA